MKIIMLGAPGAGKGTQAKMIAEKYGIPHVSTGDIFRANIKNGTELGKEAKKYMDQGLLVPDELTVKILLDRVAQAGISSFSYDTPFRLSLYFHAPRDNNIKTPFFTSGHRLFSAFKRHFIAFIKHKSGFILPAAKRYKLPFHAENWNQSS